MRAVWLCGWLLWSTLLAAEPWQVAGDQNYPPYSYLDARQQPAGLDVELMRAVLDDMQVEYRLRLYPWERVRQLLERRQVQVAFQFADTPERRAQYELAGPLSTGINVLITTPGFPLQDWQSLTQLKSYRVGQVRGYVYGGGFDEAELVRNTSAGSPRQLVSMLMAGRVDLIVGDRIQLLHYGREQGVESRLRVMARPLTLSPGYAAFAKGDRARAEQFAAAAQRLWASGRMDAIIRRWQ